MTPDHQNALCPVTLSVGGLTLEGFSLSGIATWLRVVELDVMFDAGECELSCVPIPDVFLTHAHGDHYRCLLRHWQLRRMFGLNAARYHVPASAVASLRDIVAAEARMEGVTEEVVYPNLLPRHDKETFSIRKGLWARAFSVEHRAPSLAYTVGRTVNKLRPTFAALTGPEIAALRQAGTTVTDSVDTALVTFLGDHTGAALRANPHIWDSKVVVVECTYVEPEDQANAAARTHTHLAEIVDVLREVEAPACEALVLKHFSLKNNPRRIREVVEASLPDGWGYRTHLLLPPA